MTETDWLACREPRAMLKYLTSRPDHDAQDMRFLLFAAACVRQRWHWLTDNRLRAAVDAAEGFAEGWVSADDFDRMQERAEAAYDEIEERDTAEEPSGRLRELYASYAAYCLTFCGPDDAWFAAHAGVGNRLPTAEANALKPIQGALARCVFGNPFRPVNFEPIWRTPLVERLAEVAHDERREPEGTLDPERLAILADALEDAGCTESAIREHLRGPGPHIWGCWVLALLLPTE